MVAMLRRQLATLKAGPAALTIAAHRRLPDAEWQRLRRQVVRRDAGICQACQSDGRAAFGVEVDHICPLWEGGSDRLSNLQLLCRRCHREKTIAEAARRAAFVGKPKP